MAATEIPVDADTDNALYSMPIYMDGFDSRAYSDPRRSNLMGYCDDEHFVLDTQMREKWPTGTSSAATHWQHCGGTGMIALSAVDSRVDSTFVRCFDKWRCKRRIFDLMVASCVGEVDVSKLYISLVCFDRPF